MSTEQKPNTFVFKIIYAYMLAMHLILPAVVFYMYPAPEGQSHSFAIQDMFPANFSAKANAAIYAVAFLSFICAFIIPKILGRRGSTAIVSMLAHGQLNETNPITQAFAPYMIRLVLFETTTLCGFVAAFLAQAPTYILPLTVLGLLGAVLSPPTEEFMISLTAAKTPFAGK